MRLYLNRTNHCFNFINNFVPTEIFCNIWYSTINESVLKILEIVCIYVRSIFYVISFNVENNYNLLLLIPKVIVIINNKTY